MQEGVEEEPPNVMALIGSVDEGRVDGHGAGHVHLSRDDCVVREHAQLLEKKRTG